MKKMTGKGMRIAAALGICASLMLGTPGMSISAMAATSTVDGAMIRNEPSTDAGIIGSLYEGDEVTVLGAKQSGDGYTWYYIQLDNGNTGYVRGDLLSVDDSEIEALGLEEDTLFIKRLELAIFHDDLTVTDDRIHRTGISGIDQQRNEIIAREPSGAVHIPKCDISLGASLETAQIIKSHSLSAVFRAHLQSFKSRNGQRIVFVDLMEHCR